MKNLILSSILFSFISFQSLGQNYNTESHQIDLKKEQCHNDESNQTTYGMMECEAIAREEWNNEITKYYSLLMSVLNPQEVEKLKISQNNWIKYKESEYDYAETIYYNMKGTMWRIVAISRECEISKRRALSLKGYYEMLTFNDDEN